MLLGESSAAASTSSKINDIDICVVVEDVRLGRMRSLIGGTILDAFVGGKEQIVDTVHHVRVEQLVTLCAYSQYAWGDRQIGSEIQAVAKAIDAAGPPLLSQGALFRFKCEPFDLLRKYLALSPRDVPSAQLVLSRLIGSCIDAFFARNRAWNPEIARTIERLRERDPDCARAVANVLEASPHELASNPHLVESMVNRLAGSEPPEAEFWTSLGNAKTR